MKKLFLVQKISSIIPFYSSYVIYFITMCLFRRYKATPKAWLHFIAITFSTVFLVFVLNSFIMTGDHKILNVLASGALMAISNILCVDLQSKCYKEYLE